MASPDCSTVRPNKIFTFLCPCLNFSCGTRPPSTSDFSDEQSKPANASDPYPLAICAPSTGGSGHTHMHTLYSLLFTLAFPEAITSISSSLKSQSLQRAPFTRPGPGSTDSRATGSHTGKVCTTLATPATASARLCHTSSLLGLLKFQRSKVFNRQAGLSNARSAAAVRISGKK
eukprot:363895-Chlamydomonas_euryale.AAC.4